MCDLFNHGEGGLGKDSYSCFLRGIRSAQGEGLDSAKVSTATMVMVTTLLGMAGQYVLLYTSDKVSRDTIRVSLYASDEDSGDIVRDLLYTPVACVG